MKAIELSSNELQKLSDGFLNALFKKIASAGLVLQPHWDIDHLCFRADTSVSYEVYKDVFSKLGKLLTESDVNGRPIATFELNYPIRYQNWLIRLIELPAPKKGKPCKTGFEHIEIVVDKSLANLAEMYSGFKWDKSGLQKIFNPELELSFGECAIKFHNLSLKSVINFENRPKFAVLVSELKLFEMFKNYEPFIGGTIPLAIDGNKADIDFLVSISSHKEFADMCTKSFSSMTDFEMSQGHQNGADYSLCQFRYHDVLIEIYGSQTSTFEQNGYLHFQIEEKLLKYGLIDWESEIIRLKSEGLKTEPAFAKLLNQDDVDPYKYMIELQRKSIRELREIIQTAKLIN